MLLGRRGQTEAADDSAEDGSAPAADDEAEAGAPAPAGRRPRARTKADAAAVAALSIAEGQAYSHTQDPTAAAFFDVDNTLLAGASIFYFARGLAARDFFHTRDLLRFVWQHVAYRLSGQENMEGIRDVREAALAFVAGRDVAEIVRYGEEIYDERMAERIISGTRALAENHLEAGVPVWLVTATPVELASIIARRLGLTGALGTVSEIVDGRYTGHLVGDPLHGPAKAEAVKALAEREGLDLAKCFAYSDSVNDAPMLSLVGHPTAINPDPDLKALAKDNGWPVRDFRTARKAARVGIPTAAGVGAIAGGVAAGVALRRRYVTQPVATGRFAIPYPKVSLSYGRLAVPYGRRPAHSHAHAQAHGKLHRVWSPNWAR